MSIGAWRRYTNKSLRDIPRHVSLHGSSLSGYFQDSLGISDELCEFSQLSFYFKIFFHAPFSIFCAFRKEWNLSKANQLTWGCYPSLCLLFINLVFHPPFFLVLSTYLLYKMQIFFPSLGNLPFLILLLLVSSCPSQSTFFI